MTAHQIIFTEADARKLAGISARMASDHDGEALNATRLTIRMLDKHGLRITDVIERGVLPLQLHQPSPAPASLVRDHQRTAFVCMTRDGLWSAKEADFLDSVMHRQATLSPKQADWLADLHRRFVRSAVQS